MKRYLKKWVENLLLIIEFIIIILLSADCDSLLYFTISKIILVFILLLNFHILYNYSRLFNGDFL